MYHFKNIKNQVFGRLTVLERAGIESKNTRRCIVWKCICSCGNFKNVSSNSLIQHKTMSCGCWQKELARYRQLLRPYESLYNFLKSSASARKHVQIVELSYEEFVEFTKINHCHYCGTEIIWANFNRNATKRATSYHLDRKDNDMGYTKNNCVVCCPKCNRGKCEMFTYDEWFAMTKVFRDKGSE